MNFLDNFVTELRNFKNRDTDTAIYLYGAGILAQRITDLLAKYGISVDGYIVDGA